MTGKCAIHISFVKPIISNVVGGWGFLRQAHTYTPTGLRERPDPPTSHTKHTPEIFGTDIEKIN